MSLFMKLHSNSSEVLLEFCNNITLERSVKNVCVCVCLSVCVCLCVCVYVCIYLMIRRCVFVVEVMYCFGGVIYVYVIIHCSASFCVCLCVCKAECVFASHCVC